MAMFAAVGGPSAVYLVVPLFGALAVWMTGRLGQRLGGAPVAIGSAALLAASPTFIYQLASADERRAGDRVLAGRSGVGVWDADVGLMWPPALRSPPRFSYDPIWRRSPQSSSLAATWAPEPPHFRLRDGLVVAVPAVLAALAVAYLQISAITDHRC